MLEPAFVPGEAGRLDAVGHAEFADRLGKIVAHRAFRKAEPPGDLGAAGAFAGDSSAAALRAPCIRMAAKVSLITQATRNETAAAMP